MQRMLAPLARAVANMIVRGALVAADSSKKMQSLQVRLLDGEVKDAVEHFEAYGYTSRPHPGAEHVSLFFGGDRSHGISIVVGDRRYRLQGLAQGEVALYTDEDQSGGHRIYLKRGNEIHLVAGASSIVMKPSGITITTPSLDVLKV